jgi:hypothetical protein
VTLRLVEESMAFEKHWSLQAAIVVERILFNSRILVLGILHQCREETLAMHEISDGS